MTASGCESLRLRTRLPAKARCACLLVYLLACCTFACIGRQTVCAQEPTAGPACATVAGEYKCSVDALKSTVTSAKTFAVRSSARDRIGVGQLRSLGTSLDKSLALANQPADLTFVLVSVESGGVNYGSMDRALATLKVYGRGGEAGNQNLIWVETLAGQPDLPWAAVVRQLIEKFRDRLK